MTESLKVYTSLTRAEYEARIVSDSSLGRHEFVLQWHDYVANEWSETFETLGAALIALGILDEAIVTTTGVKFEGFGASVEDIVMKHTT